MDDALKLQLNYLQLSKVTSTDKVIGRGAYGRVIEVYVHGTLCAAKEIHPALVENVSAQESEAIRRSFCEECVKASRIHHPNIVQMLGIYYPTPQAKLPWLVMELMQTSLKGFLETYEEGKVPLHFKLSMLVDVAQGLEFLHGQDIIHRDLSSNNVLLTKNLIAKIADLGVAKVIQENKMKTHTQAPGTTHFMPPEALKSKPHYGKPVDVFSLACVALQVMSHQWPEPKDLLPEDSMTALTEMQRRDEYITFCTLPALKELVELCLHNKPEQRPEISAVCVKLKELKVTIDKQIPFATNSNFELFDAVRQANIQNQKLCTTCRRLTDAAAQCKATIQKHIEEKQSLIQEKGQQIQERDDQLREKDQQIQKRDDQLQEKYQQIRERDIQLREKDQQIQEKDQQIQEKDRQIQEKDRQIQEKDQGDEQIREKDQVQQKDGQMWEEIKDLKVVNEEMAPPDSTFGRTDLNHLKNRLQHQKEVTQTMVQTGTAGPHSQATGNYTNTEIPYQGPGVSDNTTKPVAGKTDLTSLKNKLKKIREEREKAMGAGNVSNVSADYYNVDFENPVTINNPPDKKPMAGPRTVTPAGHANNDTSFALSASSSKVSYLLWQCAHCQTVNKAHHTACEHCKLSRGKMANRSCFCESCQLMMYLPPKGDFKDTCCPQCKKVYESVL